MNHSISPRPFNRAAGRKRDEILANTLAASTQRFLQNFHFEKGMIGLDLGCGTGNLTLQLQSLVGQEGKMVGIDADATNVNIAKEKTASNNQGNVQFFQKDMTGWEGNEQYDFVYSRLLFNQLTQPMKVLQQIFQSLKPGGWVMIEDMNLSNCYCYPNSYAFERYVELVTELEERMGTDANISSEFGVMLRNANFERIQVKAAQPTFLQNGSKRIPSLLLENIFDLLLAEQLATVSELQALLLELRTFENRLDTLIALPSIYQAWGYKGKSGPP